MATRGVPISVPLVLLLMAGGCTTMRETSPQRTATEQLLISNAADRAAERIALDIPAGTKVFVDATNFDSGNDSKHGKYAIGAIRDQLVQHGANLMPTRRSSDMVVEIRSGALSIDEHTMLIGIPQFDVPIPLAGALKLPEIALYKRRTREGVAKFGATAYGAKAGQYVDATGPQYGFSHLKEWTVMLLINWREDDLMPDGARDRPRGEPFPKPVPRSPPAP